MPSKVAKGNRDKKKTKDWFIKQGYTTEYLEKLQSIFSPRGIIHIKRDLFGADGLSMNGKDIIFWNSKSRVKDMQSDLRKFDDFNFPDYVTTAIVVWEPRAREPVVLRKIHGQTYQGLE